MHAIANYILENDPSKRVVYVTSEKFTNEIVEAVRGSNNDHSQSLKDFQEQKGEQVHRCLTTIRIWIVLMFF